MSNKIIGIRRRTWAEINLDNARHNFLAVRSSAKSKICCVVKANAYGHGAVALARLYEKLGADFLAVSNIEEALQLRKNGITLPVLILGYSPEECVKILAENDISQCVYSYEYGMTLAKCAGEYGVKLKIHIKIDSGMGRIGFQSKKGHCELDEALQVCRCESLVTEGIFTHFAVADESTDGEEYTKEQFDNFTNAVRFLESRGIVFQIHHCANSAAIFDYPQYHMDMVRAGIVLYGLKPSQQVRNLPELMPVMTLKSVISHIKNVFPGECVSYGRKFTADRKMTVATVPIGYADGFWRNNGNKPYVIMLGSLRVPILGRICMDQLMIDVTGIECSVGDIVTVFGGKKPCTADDIAQINGTINYEVVCAVGERVPRAYIKDEKIVEWHDSII